MARTDKDVPWHVKTARYGEGAFLRYGLRVTPMQGRGLASREYNARNHVYWDDDAGAAYSGRVKRRHVRRVSKHELHREYGYRVA